MEERNIFLNLSPLDHRYFLSNRKEFDELSLYLSEEAGIRYCIRVEFALLKTLVKMKKDLKNKEQLIDDLEDIMASIHPQEVYEEETHTQHNIRALVNIIKKKAPENISHLVHLGATSQDIIDTANSMRIRDGVRNVVLPLLVQVEEVLIRLAEEHAETPQIGRTHGQHAVPITFGFALSSYVSRLGKSIWLIHEHSLNLRGKLSGAVGAYNATSIITTYPEHMEKDFLEICGLKPSEHSTQIIESEYLLRLLLELNIAFGIIANMADDLRNLQRSEIQEVHEQFTKEQVGSSTMPQKRNPWNCEHVKSLWKAFSPRVLTFFMDQISDHQRDLTNSASSRFVTDYIAGFTAAVRRMFKVLSTLSVDRKKMDENLKSARDMVLAEPAYILLALGGEPEAHEVVRKLTLECEKNNSRLVEVLKKDEKLWNIITKQLNEVGLHSPEIFFTDSSRYRGRAVEKIKEITEQYRTVVNSLKQSMK